MEVIVILIALVAVWYFFESRATKKKLEVKQKELDLRLQASKKQISNRPKKEKRTKTIPANTPLSDGKFNSQKLSLNTGIAELDGPGMFLRLTKQGPSASAVYLLYSEEHNAYKVGYCVPSGIAKRINQIKLEISDVKLEGTAVFSNAQRAFDAEQRILAKYEKYKYRGINGRWSGSTEWITVRPTGKPYLTKPSIVEEKYQKELKLNNVRPKEEDNYTVYLMNSQSRGSFKVSWCNTTNLSSKIKNARKEFASDVMIVARIPVQNMSKARAIAIKMNEDAGTFEKHGRNEVYTWAQNPSYLPLFYGWDPNGQQRK